MSYFTQLTRIVITIFAHSCISFSLVMFTNVVADVFWCVFRLAHVIHHLISNVVLAQHTFIAKLRCESHMIAMSRQFS